MSMFIFQLTNWMDSIMTLGHQILNYGLRVKVMLIILLILLLLENEVSRWLKIDAQLCIVIKSTIHSSLKQIFRTYETCLKFRNKQNYYTPMILNVFMVCSKYSHNCCSQMS